MSAPLPHIVIAGADPAAIFAALTAAQGQAVKVTLLCPDDHILPTWRDDAATCLGITREIWDPAELAGKLVAGEKEMIGPLTRFGPGDIEVWLEAQGLALDIADERVQVTDHPASQLKRFFAQLLHNSSIYVLNNATLRAVDIKSTGGFWLTLTDERTIQADKLIIAGGGLISNPMARVITSLDHTLTPLFPALTGFQSMDKRLRGVQGKLPNLSELRIGDTDRNAPGYITLEPWGFSGPAVWALSTRYTERLHKLQYRFPLRVSWLPGGSRAAAKLADRQLRRNPRSQISSCEETQLPNKLWQNLLDTAGVPSEEYWNELSPPQRSSIVRELSAGEFEVVKKKNVQGISAVMGGVTSEEIDFRTLASQKVPDLYFAGNVLDVCADSPEINLQVDWTTGWIAGAHAANFEV